MSTLARERSFAVSLWRRRAVRLLVYATLLAVAVVMLYPFWLMAQV